MSHRQVPFYGLIQQQHLRAGFWASQGHSWWNYWDSPPFITAWHVSCSRFWCRKVTAGDSSLFVEQPSKTTSCVYRTERKCSHASNCSPACTQSHEWKFKSGDIFAPTLFMKFTAFHLLGIYPYRNTAKDDAIKPPQISTQIGFYWYLQGKQCPERLLSLNRR